jgi:hypothetical protein
VCNDPSVAVSAIAKIRSKRSEDFAQTVYGPTSAIGIVLSQIAASIRTIDSCRLSQSATVKRTDDGLGGENVSRSAVTLHNSELWIPPASRNEVHGGG